MASKKSAKKIKAKKGRAGADKKANENEKAGKKTPGVKAGSAKRKKTTERSYDIEAAGGVVVRSKKGKRQVLLIHRPAYKDWSLPKGKLDPGETAKQAALREVAEETGFACATDKKLSPIDYRVGRRSKRVRYWLMHTKKGSFVKNREVDKILWLSPGAARKKLTYEHDVAVLREAVKVHKALSKKQR